MALTLVLTACRAAPTGPPTRFGVHVLWFDGANDDNRADIDRFLDCVVHGSNLNQ